MLLLPYAGVNIIMQKSHQPKTKEISEEVF